MNLIDVHAHMDYEPLDQETEKIITESKEKNLKIIISNGTSPESNRNVKQLSEKYELIKPAYGYYPTHIEEDSEEQIEEELKWIEKHKPLALGEVGLDYKFDNRSKKYSDEEIKQAKEKQKKYFRKIIRLSKKLNIPLIIHSRKAELDVIEILEDENAEKIVMHCFLGKKKLVKRIQDNGWTLSIPVTVLKLEQLQETVKTTPLSQLMTETDSPFLGPQAGIPNKPYNVELSIKKIAELKGMNPEETADQIFMNYQNMFL